MRSLCESDFLCYKTPPLPYQNTGNANGRPPKADRLELRPQMRVGPKVRNWAILELAAKERGFQNVSRLLDDTAQQMQADLRLPDAKVKERARAILKQLGKL